MASVDQIVDYENGELSEDETIDLFAELVRTGLAWTLQGHYGRIANAMISQGLIDREGHRLAPPVVGS